MTSTTRRTLGILTLAGALALLPARAYAADRPDGAGSLLQRGTSFATMVWSFLQSLWGEEGGSLDPNGATAAGDAGTGVDAESAATPGETGGSLDPNG